MTVRPNTRRTFAERSRPRPVSRDVTVASFTPSLQTNSQSSRARPDDFETWLAWLDETCALVRGMAIEAGVRYHARKLAELAAKQMGEAA